MFQFMPMQLMNAARRVVDAHPDRVSDLERPGKLESTAFGQRLVAKLRRTPEDALPTLVAGFDAFERGFLSTLAVLEDAEVRKKALICLRIAPELARYQHLWDTCCWFYFDDSTMIAVELLLGQEALATQLSEVQTAILEGAGKNVSEGLHRFWAFAIVSGQSIDWTWEEARIPEGCILRYGISVALLNHGKRAAWEMHPPSDLVGLFDKLLFLHQVPTFARARDLYATDYTPDGVNLYPHLEALFEALETRTDLQDTIRDEEPEVWAWCQRIFNFRTLATFFTEADRRDFWMQYLDQMVRTVQDSLYERLFIDFGGFGVLEFGQIGNAAYVYDREYFQYVMDKNQRKRPVQNADLKNTTRALERLIHNGDWQWNFKGKLNRLFVRYPNVG